MLTSVGSDPSEFGRPPPSPRAAAQVPMAEAERLGTTESGDAAGTPSQLLLQALRREAETDREVMEAGLRAFVSYVRGYKEHHCKYIFRIQDLALGRVATSFALLHLPRMPEVKKARGQLEHFTPSQVSGRDGGGGRAEGVAS